MRLRVTSVKLHAARERPWSTSGLVKASVSICTLAPATTHLWRSRAADPCFMQQHLAKLAFAASLSLAGAAIYYSHWAQVEDKRLMHQAVIRDKARLKELKRQQQEK